MCSRCLQFNQFSVPVSLSNMNDIHNTFFVATLNNVVQHFLSQLKKTMLSLPLAINTSNAENNRSFDLKAQAGSWLAAMFVVPRLPCDFCTCAIWFTLSRAAFEPIEKCEMNFRWIVQIHADFTSNKVFSQDCYPCYFQDKVINCEVCVHTKHVLLALACQNT